MHWASYLLKESDVVELFKLAAMAIGFAVVAWFLFWVLAEVLRAMFWAVWTLIPVMRGNVDQVTTVNVIKFLWRAFWGELMCTYRYESRSSKYYSHGYWPWNDRNWH